MESDFRKKLEDYRIQINDIDHKLVDLLNERAKIVMNVKKLKQKEDVPLYRGKNSHHVLPGRLPAERGSVRTGNP